MTVATQLRKTLLLLGICGILGFMPIPVSDARSHPLKQQNADEEERQDEMCGGYHD